jgi:hypothetical protein
MDPFFVRSSESEVDTRHASELSFCQGVEVMPHLFVNRLRLHSLTKDQADLQAHFRWETINAALYKIGGIVFIIGSVLFFPAFEKYADDGAWTFFFGSLLYLVVTVHDLLEVRRHWRAIQSHDLQAILEYAAAASYTWGTILFTIGSVFFLSTVGWFRAGAWCFVSGSLLFVTGASINVIQIVRVRSMLTLQLMNLTAIAFVVGSVLFTVASIPYLWDVGDTAVRTTLYTFLAAQYLIGSFLFFLGGVFNYWRAYVVVKQQVEARPANP